MYNIICSCCLYICVCVYVYCKTFPPRPLRVFVFHNESSHTKKIYRVCQLIYVVYCVFYTRVRTVHRLICESSSIANIHILLHAETNQRESERQPTEINAYVVLQRARPRNGFRDSGKRTTSYTIASLSD